jgi:riboflavin biosynthesis pyrimidine reductase
MNRPEVVILSSASLDGRVTISSDTLLLYGDERWTKLEEAGGFNVFKWLKSEHQPGATLEGSSSFVLDGTEPEPLPPYEGDHESLFRDFLPESVIHNPEVRGWFTAVDGRGRVRWFYKAGYPDPEWQGWYLLVLVSYQTPVEYLAYLQRENIPYLIAGDERVDLDAVLQKMKSELGVSCVLSTAGGKLNGALLRAGLVDEININFLPAIIGGFDTPTLFEAPDLISSEMPIPLALISAQVQPSGHVWLRYQVENEGLRG